jgi:polyhydroxyalkanoate synthesis regulator phasin
MSEENAPEENDGSGTQQDSEEKSRTDSIKGGIKQGIGKLNAMKDAIEETLNEAKERGDLSPERAKELMRSTLERAQAKAGEAREALDFVKQKDFDGLRSVVDGLKDRVKSVERSLGREVEDASKPSTEED